MILDSAHKFLNEQDADHWPVRPTGIDIVPVFLLVIELTLKISICYKLLMTELVTPKQDGTGDNRTKALRH